MSFGMPSRPLLRRSPSLVAYWLGGRFVMENYLTNQRRDVGPGVVDLLNQFDRWQKPATVLKRVSGKSRDELERLIRTLTADSFLQAHGPNLKPLGAWEAWHPVASFFHFATKDPRFAITAREADAVERNLRARVSKRPLPVKRYPGRPFIALPPPSPVGEFPRVLLSRRTWRRFASRPIELSSLSKLLALSFGVHWKLTLDVVGTVFLTTSPSGGSRHPIEAYVIVQNVSGLAPGLYHYQGDRHRLTRIGKRPTRREIRACFPAQSWCATAPVIVFLTAVFGRTQWKYPNSRAYRVLLAEAGHVCQTFCLTATWLGLAPFCTMALADSVIDRQLKLDGVSESVIYAAGVGGRLRGKRWTPWPDDDEVPRVRSTGIIPQPRLR